MIKAEEKLRKNERKFEVKRNNRKKWRWSENDGRRGREYLAREINSAREEAHEQRKTGEERGGSEGSKARDARRRRVQEVDSKVVEIRRGG